MDINLPLILMIAVFSTGAIWVFDVLFIMKKRKLSIDAVDAQFAELSASEKESDLGYTTAHEAASREPVVVEYAKSFFPVLAVVFVLRSFIVEPFQIPSGSMIPTLAVGDYIVVSKSSYGVRLPVFRNKVIGIDMPERGEVVVFFPPHKEQYFIKRLIGLPGDKIRYANHQLYVNGEKVEQKFLGDTGQACSGLGENYILVEETVGDNTFTSQKCSRPGRLSIDGYWEVPEGHYFMMGDNRDNSSDSREWGAVPEENLVGNAFAVWMHWKELASVPSFSRAGLIN